jgi:hypothetical protein
MKKYLKLGALILAAVIVPTIALAVQITVPKADTSGQVLISNADGSYSPQTLSLSGGGGGAGVSATTTITQAVHGFSVGQWVGLTPNNTYALANAVPGGTYQAVGIVASVPDANTFVLQTAGDFTDTNLIPGMTYYLSASSTLAQGSIVGYPPSTGGYISAPVAIAKTQTTATIQIGRSSIVAAAAGSEGMNIGFVSTSTSLAQLAILDKNLANKRGAH